MEALKDPATLTSLTSVFRLVVPEAVLGLFACVLFVLGTVKKSKHLAGMVALLGIAAAAWAAYAYPGPTTHDLIASVSPLWPDGLAFFTRVVALTGGAILILLSWNEVPDPEAADFHACLLVIVAGTSLTGYANELVTLFSLLELISIPTYVMLYLPRGDRAAQEASVKYFLLSIFSSALLLFGFSYLYGVTGTTNLPAILSALAGAGPTATPGLVTVGLVLVIAGLGFRITAVPFHFYAPDVYQGAPVSGAALLAFVPKVAGFAALVRVLGLAGAGPTGNGFALNTQVTLLLWILAAVTMTVGNVLALLQDDLKRILAYSSVAHAGYMLIGLTVAPYLMPQTAEPEAIPGGVEAVLFYLVAYGAMTLGAFGVIALLSTHSRPVTTVDDLAGLGRSDPGVALMTALFLFSLIGLPLTAGFAGKFFLFFGAMAAPGRLAAQDLGRLFQVLALVAALNAAVGAYYYLRIIGVMFLRDGVKPPHTPRRLAGLMTLWLCAGLTLWLGVDPWPLLRLTRTAATPPAPAAATR